MSNSPMDSAIGIAKQTDAATINTTDADFKYTQFEASSLAPTEVQRIIPRLAGSTKSLPAGFVKAGVYAAGAMDLLKCTDVIGKYLYGLMGYSTTPTASGDLHIHEYDLPADEFDLPYFTARRRVAGLWHEAYRGCRISGLQMTVPAADMVRFTVGITGIAPQVIANATAEANWAISTYLDDTDPFLACAATLTAPIADATFVARNVVVACANALALDESWFVGSYYPYDLSLGGRTVAIQCDILADADLFVKMAYDPDGTGGDAQTWTPEILKGGAFAVEVATQADIPHTLKFEADSVNDNIVWMVEPVGVRGADNKQLMRVNGVLVQSAGEQVRWTLTNGNSANDAA